MEITTAQHVVDHARALNLLKAQYDVPRKEWASQGSYLFLREWLLSRGYRYLRLNARGIEDRPSLYNPTNDRMRVEFSATRIRFQVKRGSDWRNHSTRSLIEAAKVVLLDAQASLLARENPEQVEAVLRALPLAYRERMIVALDRVAKRAAPIAGMDDGAGRWWRG